MKSVALFFFATIWNVAAQYEIHWFTTDGGGGQSTGGVYMVTGTIGQPDAATMAGGSYLIQGGFWIDEPVGDEDVPLLRLSRSSSHVTLGWPHPSPGFELQVAPGLSTPTWSVVTNVPSVVGMEKQVTRPVEAASEFFRLRRP